MDRYLLDSHKLLWHLDRVLEWQKKKVITPIYIEISPVSFCNHKCIFCGIDFARDASMPATHRQDHYLNREILCNRLIEMGKVGVKSIMFAGEGEPLLHKDINTFIKTANTSGIDVSMTTNGSMGSYDIWRDILPFMTWIRFSVDAGTSEVYTIVHNVPESSFGKTISSIEDAVRVKKEERLGITIGVQFLIIEENLNDIENALSLFSGIDIDYLSLKPYSLHPQMINKREVIYSEETIDYLQDIVDRYKAKTKIEIIFRKDAMKKYMDKGRFFSHCRALPFWGYISTNGDFYTCSVFIGKKGFRAGNIYDNDIQGIISGDVRKNSIEYGENGLNIGEKCRLNCRMARINEFLELLENKPQHINFI